MMRRVTVRVVTDAEAAAEVAADAEAAETASRWMAPYVIAVMAGGMVAGLVAHATGWDTAAGAVGAYASVAAFLLLRRAIPVYPQPVPTPKHRQENHHE